MNKRMLLGGLLAAALVVTLGVAGGSSYAKMKKPETVVISGTLIDITCAAKGMAMMGSDYNAAYNDHKTPDGVKKSCATMCLQGGMPAGLYSDGKISAVLLANPSANLYKFAAKTVEIEGFWAGQPKDDVKTFNPAKIRLKGTTDWTEVQTRAMHK